MLVQILSVRYLVIPVTDRQKITAGDRADGLTIRHTDRQTDTQLTFYSRINRYLQTTIEMDPWGLFRLKRGMLGPKEECSDQEDN